MAATSGCVDEAPNNCVPGDNFDCVDDVDAGNGGDDDDTGTTTPEEVCDDTLDNDGDGDVDCDDSDCDDAANCTEQPDDDEVCNDNIDNDGDGNVDCDDSDCDTAANCIDVDGDGFATEDDDGNVLDCDDGDASVNPNAIEVCNMVDDNCDGQIDNDAVDTVTYFADNDGDGYGDDDNGTSTACVAPDGFVENNEDCDDGNASVHPGAPEICDNLIDDDCADDIDCADVLCDGQAGATVSFDIGSLATDGTPLGSYVWEDNSHGTSEVLPLCVTGASCTPGVLPGASFTLWCGVDTYLNTWVYTDSISVTASPSVSILSDGSSPDLGMDTSAGPWGAHTSYSSTPSQGVWYNLHICIEEPCSPE